MKTTHIQQIKVIVPMEFDQERIAGLLCGAFEGGSNYWCSKVYRIKGEHHGFMSDDIASGAVSVFGVFDQEEGKRHICRSSDLAKGLQIMAEKYPRHFADFLSENGDATTGDVFFQCVVFGDAIYG